jgi:polyhydroxybutyrate depolymerase
MNSLRIVRRSIVWAALLPAGVLSTPHTATAQSGSGNQHSLVWDGLTRTYRVHVPSGYEASTPAPLVIVFHGAGSSSDDMENLFGVDKTSDRAGFVAVYPQGIDAIWHTGLVKNGPGPQVDDLGFVRALLTRLESDYSIDKNRVYAVGFSNGAFFTQRVACAMASDFAAVASVSGQMSHALSTACTPSRPISVLLIHGTDDPVVPYDGGSVQGSRSGNPLLSVDATVSFWMHTNTCPKSGASDWLPDARPADGTHVRHEAHTGCAAGTEVTLYSIRHGGHTWPDGPQYDQIAAIGRVSHALDNGAIWEFLARHPLAEKP